MYDLWPAPRALYLVNIVAVVCCLNQVVTFSADIPRRKKGKIMAWDEMEDPCYQRMVLIDSLTDEEKIQLYPKEYAAVLRCSKIPDLILKRVLSSEATIIEQLHFVHNKFIGDNLIKILYLNTAFNSIREDAFNRLYKNDESLKIGMEIVKVLSHN